MSTRFPSSYLSDYELIGRFRGFQMAIAEKYSLQMMRCPVHLSIGQEYWLPPLRKLAGSSVRCFSSHRSHSMYMGLGGNFEKMIAELHGHPNGVLGGRGGSMHLKDLSVGLEQSVPIVGSSLGLALGSGLAAQHQKENTLTIAYFGDGACEEGILHESLNIASVFDLPILFICENNQYSCNTHLYRRQSSSKMSRFSEAHGIQYDTLDPELPYGDIVSKIERAFNIGRKSSFFLEIASYRLYEHCGHLVDTDKGDRSQKEFLENLCKDVYTMLANEYPTVLTSFQDSLSYYGEMIQKYSMINKSFIVK